MKIKLLVTLMLACFRCLPQSPINWQFGLKKIGEDVFECNFKATLSKSWHIYSQFSPSGGPKPTSIHINRNPLILVEAATKEIGKIITKREEIFGVDVKYFNDSIIFVKVVRLKKNLKTNISGIIEYMICSDNECQPPQKRLFSIEIK